MTYWKCLLCAVCILLPLCFAAGCAAFPKADDPPEPPQETVDTPAEPDIPVVPAPEPEPEPEPAEDALVDVCTYLPGVYADLRYATENNFTGQVIYDFTQPQLRYGTLKKLAQAQEMLAERDLALKIWDAYRPVSAQFRLWGCAPIRSMWPIPQRAIPDIAGATRWTSRWCPPMVRPFPCPRILTISPPWRTGITVMCPTRQLMTMSACWRTPWCPAVFGHTAPNGGTLPIPQITPWWKNKRVYACHGRRIPAYKTQKALRYIAELLTVQFRRDQIARVTLPERRHRVQTYTWRGVPLITAFTRLTLGFQGRLERR